MAANYKVNIELDTKKLDAQLKRLKKQVGEVGKVKRVGGGGSKGGIIANDADDKFLRTAGIRLRKLATAQNTLINKANKIAAKGGMLALPSAEMRAAEKTAEILAKQTERKANAERRSAEFAKDAMKANQASAKAGVAHANKLDRMRRDTGFSASQYGPQFDSMSLPTESALNFDKRTGKLLRGPAGSGGRSLRNLGRRFDTQSALISGGFPLLFGQGPLGALAGGLGGGIGGMFGQMGGFAGGIAATAALQTVSNAVNGVRQFGEGLQDVEGALATVTEKSLFSSEATEKRAEALKKLGKQEELAKLLTQELTITLGQGGLQRIQAVGKASKELARTFGQLGASLQNVLSIVVLPAIKALNNVLSGFTIPQRFKNFKESLSGSNLTRFNQIVNEERGFTKKNLRGGKTKMVQGKLTNLGMSNALDKAVGEGIGGSGSAFTTASDPTIAASLQDRIAFLNRSLEVGRERAELERKIAEFRKKGTDLSDKELEIQLKQIAELEEIEALYQEIGSAIENGIVDAIEGAINGTKTLGDVARSVFAQIQRSLISYGVNAFLGGIGLPGFANGGRPPVGRPSIVGEKGPELFVPDKAGTIIPNHQLGGSTNVVVNVDASGSSVEGDEAQGRELGRLISVAVQSEIVQQQRPGGLLA